MDWFLLLIAPLLVVALIGWHWQRRRVAEGLTCWNCGADLSERALHVDGKGRSRCPKCGNEMDVTDVYRMPRQ